tara:strand:+ start:289 stop:540 length:252 start_codon:yes stop_codon:yes gene_type:complete
MITELLAALRAVPKILDALERLGDCMTAQLAQQRKDDKNEMVDDLISAAKSRREQRLSGGKTQRISGDSKPSCCGDGGCNCNP